jgi:hypothetical protein
VRRLVWDELDLLESHGHDQDERIAVFRKAYSEGLSQLGESVKLANVMRATADPPLGAVSTPLSLSGTGTPTTRSCATVARMVALQPTLPIVSTPLHQHRLKLGVHITYGGMPAAARDAEFEFVRQRLMAACVEKHSGKIIVYCQSVPSVHALVERLRAQVARTGDAWC